MNSVKNAWFASLLFALVTIGCKGSAPGAAGEKAAPRTETATTGAEAAPRELTVEVERAFGEPSIPVTLTLPGSWSEGTHDAVARFLPKKQPDEFFQTRLEISEGSISCQGECDRRQVLASIDSVREAFEKGLVQPDVNSADPGKDAPRAKVEVLEDSEEEGSDYRRVFAAKVTCPGEGTTPCTPRLAARCFYYVDGQDFHLVAAGVGPIAAENGAWTELMALCKGLRISANEP